MQSSFQAHGLPVSDDPSLEAEADSHGAMAARGESIGRTSSAASTEGGSAQRKAVQAKLNMKHGYTEMRAWSQEAQILINNYDALVALLHELTTKGAHPVSPALKARVAAIQSFVTTLESTEITNDASVRMAKSQEVVAELQLGSALGHDLDAAIAALTPGGGAPATPRAPRPATPEEPEDKGTQHEALKGKGKREATTIASVEKKTPKKPDEPGDGALGTAGKDLKKELLSPEAAHIEGEHTLASDPNGKTVAKGEANLVALEGSGSITKTSKTSGAKGSTTLGGAKLEGSLHNTSNSSKIEGSADLRQGEASIGGEIASSSSRAKGSITVGDPKDKTKGSIVAEGSLDAHSSKTTAKASIGDGKGTLEASHDGADTIVAASVALNSAPLNMSLFGEKYVARVGAKLDGFIGAKHQEKLKLEVGLSGENAEAKLTGAEGIQIEPPSAGPVTPPPTAHASTPAPSTEHATPEHTTADTASKGGHGIEGSASGSASAFAGAKAKLTLAGELNWDKKAPDVYAAAAAGNAAHLLARWLPANVMSYIPTSYLPTLLNFVLPYVIGGAGPKKIVAGSLGGEASAGLGAELGFNADFEGGAITIGGKAGLTLGAGLAGDYKLTLGALEGMRALSVLFMKGFSSFSDSLQPGTPVLTWMGQQATTVRKNVHDYFEARKTDPTANYFSRKVAQAMASVI